VPRHSSLFTQSDSNREGNFYNISNQVVCLKDNAYTIKMINSFPTKIKSTLSQNIAKMSFIHFSFFEKSKSWSLKKTRMIVLMEEYQP